MLGRVVTVMVLGCALSASGTAAQAATKNRCTLSPQPVKRVPWEGNEGFGWGVHAKYSCSRNPASNWFFVNHLVYKKQSGAIVIEPYSASSMSKRGKVDDIGHCDSLRAQAAEGSVAIAIRSSIRKGSRDPYKGALVRRKDSKFVALASVCPPA